MRYKFEQFNIDIDNPKVTVSSVTDYMNKTCSVSVTLTTPNVKMYGLTFDGFTYDVTWEDTDIEIFVANEMKKHEV